MQFISEVLIRIIHKLSVSNQLPFQLRCGHISVISAKFCWQKEVHLSLVNSMVMYDAH